MSFYGASAETAPSEVLRECPSCHSEPHKDITEAILTGFACKCRNCGATFNFTKPERQAQQQAKEPGNA